MLTDLPSRRFLSSPPQASSRLRTSIALGTALVLTLGSAFLGSCSPSDRRSGGIYGDPPLLEDYINNLKKLEPLLRRGTIFFEETRPPSEHEYRATVHEYNARGLEGLSQEEQSWLLAVAQLAFLAHADTLRYSAEAYDTRSASEQGETVLMEAYRVGLPPYLRGRHIVGKAIAWPFLGTLGPKSEPPTERVQVSYFDVRDSDTESVVVSQYVTTSVWDRHNGQWTCGSFRDTASNWELVHEALLSIYHEYSVGEYSGRETIDGRPAYRFTTNHVISGTAVSYWLDAETLWLRQYEYEDDGIRYTSKLEAVNEDIRIEPPDVDVPCVEEAPAP